MLAESSEASRAPAKKSEVSEEEAADPRKRGQASKPHGQEKGDKMTARPRVFKRGGKRISGRGFSSEELKKAGSSLQEAVRLHISVDPRRKTGHDDNVEVLKVLLKEKKAAAESKKPKRKSKS